MTLLHKNSRVKEIMQKNVLTIHPNQTIFDASVLMACKLIGSLSVVKEDRTFVGIITDRDLVTRCIALGKDPKKVKVYECMTTNPIRTVPSATLADAMVLMGEYGIRRLPIVENDKLIGLISIADIAKVSDACPNEKCPDHSCILIDMARELKRTSNCEKCCSSSELN